MKILEYLFYHHFDVLGTIIIGVTVRLFEKSKLNNTCSTYVMLRKGFNPSQINHAQFTCITNTVNRNIKNFINLKKSEKWKIKR